MRNIFNFKSLAAIGTGFAAAAVGIYMGVMGEKPWSRQQIEEYLATVAADQPVVLPEIENPEIRAAFADGIATVTLLLRNEAWDDSGREGMPPLTETYEDEALRVLLSMKDDADVKVREQVVTGIGRLRSGGTGPTEAEKIAILQEMAASETASPELKYLAAMNFQWMADDDGANIEALFNAALAMTTDETALVRIGAIDSVVTIGYRLSKFSKDRTYADRALPVLIGMKDDADPIARARVAGLLSMVQPYFISDPVAAIDALVSMKDDENAKVREQVVLGLHMYDDELDEASVEKAFTAIESLKGDPAYDVRLFVPGRLVDIARFYPAYIDRAWAVIEELQGDESPRVLFMLANALRHIHIEREDQARRALRNLVDLTDTADSETVREALAGIGLTPQGYPRYAGIAMDALQEAERLNGSSWDEYARQSFGYWKEYVQEVMDEQAPAPAPAP